MLLIKLGLGDIEIEGLNDGLLLGERDGLLETKELGESEGLPNREGDGLIKTELKETDGLGLRLGIEKLGLGELVPDETLTDLLVTLEEEGAMLRPGLTDGETKLRLGREGLRAGETEAVP